MSDISIDNLVLELKKIIVNFYKPEFKTRFLILYDTESELSTILKSAYYTAVSQLGHSVDAFDFYKFSEEELIFDIDNYYVKGDVIIMLQSSSYRVSKFRWRNELCQRGLKVLEHGHLGKIKENEIQNYFNSMIYDYDWQKQVADFLEDKIKKSSKIDIISENGSIVSYTGLMDFCTRNIGEFEEQTNWGSRFPIGELITESLDLSTLNGEVEVYAYPNLEQVTNFAKPFTCKIENGFLVSHTGPEDFDEIFKLIQTEHPEKKVYVREFGLGLNRFIKRFDKLSDPIAYERQQGVHFSLGMKHGIYMKKLWPKYGKKFNQRFHIDIYVNVKEILIDGLLVYKNDKGFIVS